jgi:methyl-accepting chemotaxis protein
MRRANDINSLVSDISADRKQIAAAAQESAELADKIARKISNCPFDSESALHLMQRIAGAADWISGQGERSAEQATMVLNSLVLQYSEIAKPESGLQTQMKTAIAAMFQQLENPPAYAPKTFAERMRAFRKLLD